MVFRGHKGGLVGFRHDTYLVGQVFDYLVFQDQLALEFVIVFLQGVKGVVFGIIGFGEWDITWCIDHGVFHVLVGRHVVVGGNS